MHCILLVNSLNSINDIQYKRINGEKILKSINFFSENASKIKTFLCTRPVQQERFEVFYLPFQSSLFKMEVMHKVRCKHGGNGN